MELPNLGRQCNESSCLQLDFLPLQCKCSKFFCSEHFKSHVQTCPELQTNREVILMKLDDLYTCSSSNCKIKSIVPITCETCKKHFCIAHRHFADCFPNDEELLAAKVKRDAQSLIQFNKAKAAVDKEVPKYIHTYIQEILHFPF